MILSLQFEEIKMILTTIQTITQSFKEKRLAFKKEIKREHKWVSYLGLSILPILVLLGILTNIIKFNFIFGSLFFIELFCVLYFTTTTINYQLNKNAYYKISGIQELDKSSIKDIINFVLAINLMKTNTKSYSLDIIHELEAALIYNKATIKKYKIIHDDSPYENTNPNIPSAIQVKFFENDRVISEIITISLKQFISLNLEKSEEFKNLLEQVSIEEKVSQLKNELQVEESILDKLLDKKETSSQKNNQSLAL
jgi:hypothetical protein